MNIDINSDEFKPAINGLDKNKIYYVYCHSGARSITAAGYMEEIGFTRIYNLENGITAWMGAGLPVIRVMIPGAGLPQVVNLMTGYKIKIIKKKQDATSTRILRNKRQRAAQRARCGTRNTR